MSEVEVSDKFVGRDEHNEEDSTRLDDDNQTNSMQDSDTQKKPTFWVGFLLYRKLEVAAIRMRGRYR